MILTEVPGVGRGLLKIKNKMYSMSPPGYPAG